MTAVEDEVERLLVESVMRWASHVGGVAHARALRDKGGAFDPSVWQQMADQGWTAVCVPEPRGGLGLGIRHACLLLEAVGRVLLPEPLVTSLAASHLLSRMDEVGAKHLEMLSHGDHTYVPVVQPSIEFPLRLAHVPDVHPGSVLLIGGRHKGDYVVAALESAATGVEVHHETCVDGTTLSDVSCSMAARRQLDVLYTGEKAAELFSQALDALSLGYGAYLVGLMDEALSITVDYMRTRRQFGVPIAEFQALQHRAASAYTDMAACRALVREGCRAFGGPRSAEAATAVRARTAGAAMRVTKECVQFHGAIGFTDECDIGLYLRRAMTVVGCTGGELENRCRYARLTARERPSVS